MESWPGEGGVSVHGIAVAAVYLTRRPRRSGAGSTSLFCAAACRGDLDYASVCTATNVLEPRVRLKALAVRS